MIRCHPNVDDSDFKVSIEIAIKEAELSGYISRGTLKEFFNLFSWVYIDGDISQAFTPNTKLEKFLQRFDLFRFKGESLCYSAVLFYQKLSKAIDMRQLEDDAMVSAEVGTNKMFASEDFTYKELYEIYKNNAGDLSTDFLLFNELFKTSVEKEVRTLRAYREVLNVTQITSLVRPDFPYNLATKQLKVNYDEEDSNEECRKIYVLQDGTFSMEKYEKQLKTIKAFILNEAFKNNYEVEWLFISDIINHRVTYNKANIGNIKMKFRYSGTFINTSKILTRDEFVGMQVVIITDGTDMFNFTFNTKTKNINVISFLDNINIKNKISNYGRFFKVTL